MFDRLKSALGFGRRQGVIRCLNLECKNVMSDGGQPDNEEFECPKCHTKYPMSYWRARGKAHVAGEELRAAVRAAKDSGA